MTDFIECLNNGYVRLVNVMGSDLTVVNAARVSYAKESFELNEKDIKLIKFLAREGHCYDKETEVLTNKGFVRWDKIDYDSELAVVNPESGRFIGFEKPVDIIIEDFDGELIHFDTPDVDLMVTEGHSLYCSLTTSIRHRSNPEFKLHVGNKVIEAKNGTPDKLVYEKPMRMIKATTGNCMETIFKNVPDSMFSLYGFFIGDGHASTKNSITFHLKKEKKIKYLKELCSHLNFDLKENANNTYVITQDGLGDKFRTLFYNSDKEKTFPDDFYFMNQHQFNLFIDGLRNSDGSQKRNTWQYDTMSEELANKLQALASINGLSLSKNKNHLNLFRLNANSRRIMPRLNDTENNKYKKVKYNGKVYCATVSTGLLIVRRNDKVVLCGNSSPFRHATLQFEVYAPLMVARQWWKYVVGSDHVMDAWNESSRRYITEEPVFYIPQSNEWRSAPENSKQGSGEPIDPWEGSDFTNVLKKYIEQGERLYNEALRAGICAEQARLFLPAYGMYVRWYWTASLQSVAHFLNQRLAHDAQKEIQVYAQAVYDLAIQHFPVSLGELVKK